MFQLLTKKRNNQVTDPMKIKIYLSIYIRVYLRIIRHLQV